MNEKMPVYEDIYFQFQAEIAQLPGYLSNSKRITQLISNIADIEGNSIVELGSKRARLASNIKKAKYLGIESSAANIALGNIFRKNDHVTLSGKLSDGVKMVRELEPNTAVVNLPLRKFKTDQLIDIWESVGDMLILTGKVSFTKNVKELSIMPRFMDVVKDLYTDLYKNIDMPKVLRGFFGDRYVVIYFKNEDIYNEIVDDLDLSVIIPAYNEGKRVGEVIEAAINAPVVKKVYAIDDGSKDNTLEVLKGFDSEKLEVIANEKNIGKGASVGKALRMIDTKNVMFLDSDLKNIQAWDFEFISLPLLADQDEVLGTSYTVYNYTLGFRAVNGQRVYRMDAIRDVIERIEGSNYGMEQILNKAVGDDHMVYGLFPGIFHVRKAQKGGDIPWIKQYFDETVEIVKYYLENITNR